MDFSAYTDILWNTVSFQLKFLSVIVVICLIPEIWYMTTKIKMKRSEGRTWEDISTGFILVAIFLCCYVLPSVVPMIKDIAGEHYLSAHGQYAIYNRGCSGNKNESTNRIRCSADRRRRKNCP